MCFPALSHICTDPENLEWCLFDENYRRELDKRPYVSLSHDRKYGVPTEESKSHSAQDSALPDKSSSSSEAPNTTKERSKIYNDEQDLEFDDAPSDEEDAEIPEGSLFEYHIPGVLAKEEVERLDLDHWRLLVRNALIELEVSRPPYLASRRSTNRIVGSARMGRLEDR